MPDRVTVRAHAKTNLILRVLAREGSGYHQIETLFTLLELHDTLTVERRDTGITFEVDGADTGPAERNLAYRAAEMVIEATGRTFGVRILLEKRIPMQAGLGGGSSDGAAALHAVNRLADDAVPRHELLQFAARLGADVPFFASGAPMALAWGRGERLYRITPPKPAPALVVVPEFGIPTAEAYQALAAARQTDSPRGAVVLDRTAFETWGDIGRLGGNDFEAVIFGKFPELKELFERIATTGPYLVRLSGSGSALVAVYRDERARDGAMMEVGGRDVRLIATASRREPAEGPEVD
jgi:4-diphosphocytidyl-2-C-methyl-D-erythritol kinase